MTLEPREEEEACYEDIELMNAAYTLMERGNELEDEIIVELISKLITFENVHLVAAKLIEEDEDSAKALIGEVLYQL